jgi:hypothetical protein
VQNIKAKWRLELFYFELQKIESKRNRLRYKKENDRDAFTNKKKQTHK